MKKKNILIIAPHADDEILGVGGTISKYINNNYDVIILILTNANIGAPELYTKNDIKKIRAEAIKSHKFLGVRKTIFADFPALKLDQYPSYQISNYINKLIIKYKPNLMFLPYPDDIHVDHKITYQSSMVAARPINKVSIEKILLYEVLSETNYTLHMKKKFNPNYFENITDTIDFKLKAMSYYKSQLKKYPNSRSLEMIKYLASFRGAFINAKFAESFMVERIINE